MQIQCKYNKNVNQIQCKYKYIRNANINTNEKNVTQAWFTVKAVWTKIKIKRAATRCNDGDGYADKDVMVMKKRN